MLLMLQTLGKLLISRDAIGFLLTQLGFVINLNKVCPSVSPTNRNSGLRDSSKKDREDCSDVSKCTGRMFDLKCFDKVTMGIGFHN